MNRRLALDRTDGVFAAVVVLQLLPLLLLRHVPTVDGPAHLAGARVLADLLTGPGAAVYRHYYTVDLFPSPNLLAGLVLAGLVRLTTPTAAEKLLIGGYVVLFPLGLRYALVGVSRSARWLAFLAFPLTFGYLFWYGFYGYCYGVALALFTIGFALRRRRAWRVHSALGLAVLLLLTYAAHLVPFALALLFLAALAVGDTLAARRGGDAGWRATLLAPAVAALPAVALTAAFLARGGAHAEPRRTPLGALVGGLVSLATPVVTFVRDEALFSILVALVLAVATGMALCRGGAAVRGPAAQLAAAVAAATGGFLAAPSQLGLEYGLINVRISVFPVLFLALWLAAQPLDPRLRRAGAAVFVLAAAGLAVVRVPDVTRYERQLDEYATVAGVVPAGSTLLGLRLQLDSPLHGPVRVRAFDPLRHAASLVAAQTSSVDLGHYEAQYNYFPTPFRPEANLRRRVDPDLTGLEAVPPRIVLPAEGIDYLLVWGARLMTPAVRADPATAALLDQVARHYRLVHSTGPDGLVDVYARRGVGIVPARPPRSRASSSDTVTNR